MPTKKSAAATGNTGAGTTGTTTARTYLDATKMYQKGDYTHELKGTVTKISGNNYWVDCTNGIEYKCFPKNKGDLEYIAVGDKIKFAGYVLSTSQLSVNLEDALWLGPQ